MTRPRSLLALAAVLALAGCGERAFPPNVSPPSRAAAAKPPPPSDKPQPPQPK
ncbi:MAG TPA: hypothetical protein VG939_01570 [Caulobacteraceae bacterium]|nr:hypothetical protein [Caulobacteraceae bacterium]